MEDRFKELLKDIEKKMCATLPLDRRVPDLGHNYREALEIMVCDPKTFKLNDVINLFWNWTNKDITKRAINKELLPPCGDDHSKCLMTCPARIICVHKEGRKLVARGANKTGKI